MLKIRLEVPTDAMLRRNFQDPLALPQIVNNSIRALDALGVGLEVRHQSAYGRQTFLCGKLLKRRLLDVARVNTLAI